MNHVWGRRLLRGGSSEAAFLPADGWLGPQSGAVGWGLEQASLGSEGLDTGVPGEPSLRKDWKLQHGFRIVVVWLLWPLCPGPRLVCQTGVCLNVRTPLGCMWQCGSLLLLLIPAVCQPPGHVEAPRSRCHWTCFSDRHAEVQRTEVTCPRALLPTG